VAMPSHSVGTLDARAEPTWKRKGTSIKRGEENATARHYRVLSHSAPNGRRGRGGKERDLQEKKRRTFTKDNPFLAGVAEENGEKKKFREKEAGFRRSPLLTPLLFFHRCLFIRFSHAAAKGGEGEERGRERGGKARLPGCGSLPHHPFFVCSKRFAREK